MIHREAHACLPLHPQADFSPLDRLRGAGENYLSVNVGMNAEDAASVMGGNMLRVAGLVWQPSRQALID